MYKEFSQFKPPNFCPRVDVLSQGGKGFMKPYFHEQTWVLADSFVEVGHKHW